MDKELAISISHNLARQWLLRKTSRARIIRASVQFVRSREIETLIVKGRIMWIQLVKRRARPRTSSSSRLEVTKRHPIYDQMSMKRGRNEKGVSRCRDSSKILSDNEEMADVGGLLG
jgi:hypothetical protein